METEVTTYEVKRDGTFNVQQVLEELITKNLKLSPYIVVTNSGDRIEIFTSYAMSFGKLEIMKGGAESLEKAWNEFASKIKPV